MFIKLPLFFLAYNLKHSICYVHALVQVLSMMLVMLGAMLCLMYLRWWFDVIEMFDILTFLFAVPVVFCDFMLTSGLARKLWVQLACVQGLPLLRSVTISHDLLHDSATDLDGPSCAV